MPIDSSDFANKLKSFNELAAEDSKLLGSIIREPNETFLYLVLMMRLGSTKRFTCSIIKKHGIEERGPYELHPDSASMESFGGGKIHACLQGGHQFEDVQVDVEPITGRLRETITSPDNVNALVEIVKKQKSEAFARLNQAGVTVFKRVQNGKNSVLEKSTFPEPIDMVGKSL
jgi:hypothetical protein